jgi:hypothetical protein
MRRFYWTTDGKKRCVGVEEYGPVKNRKPGGRGSITTFHWNISPLEFWEKRMDVEDEYGYTYPFAPFTRILAKMAHDFDHMGKAEVEAG